jgi:hypothetical protein
MSKAKKTVWDFAGGIAWGDRFESFTPEELNTLEVFSSNAQELAERPFFSSPINFSFKASPEESYQRLAHAGDDAMRSVSMNFRQLWSKDEPRRFEKVHELVRTHAKPGAADGVDIAALLSSLMRRYQEAKAEVAMKHVWKDDPMGEPKETFTAELVIDTWLYGGAFHTDADKRAFVKSWIPSTYEFTFVKAMRRTAVLMWELDVLVRGAIEEAAAVTVA